MGKGLNELGTYSYEIQFDGPELKRGKKITLRRMAQRERNRFLRKKAAMLESGIQSFVERWQDGTICTEDQERLHKEAKKLSKHLCTGKSMLRVMDLDDFANLLDLTGFLQRIIQVETYLEAGEDVPDQVSLVDPEEVDNLTDKEVDKQLEGAERLGEAEAPTESQTTTAPTDSRAATSSSSSDQDSTESESDA